MNKGKRSRKLTKEEHEELMGAPEKEQEVQGHPRRSRKDIDKNTTDQATWQGNNGQTKRGENTFKDRRNGGNTTNNSCTAGPDGTWGKEEQHAGPQGKGGTGARSGSWILAAGHPNTRGE